MMEAIAETALTLVGYIESYILDAETTSGYSPSSFDSSGSRGRSAFQWGGTVAALLLLILNQIGRKSGLQASLLVLFLVISFPNVLFKILRGQFGCWIAFIAVITNLCCSNLLPVSRFLLFIVLPDWLAEESRETIAGGVFCLIIGLSIVIAEFKNAGGCVGNWRFTWHCLAYWFSIFLLFLFTILYLSLGPW